MTAKTGVVTATVRETFPEVRRSKTHRDAYESFRQIAAEPPNQSAFMTDVATYLADEDAPFRDVILSCLCDYEIRVPRTIANVVAPFLHSDEDWMARSALQLFHVCRPEGELGRLLEGVPEEKRERLMKFWQFVQAA